MPPRRIRRGGFSCFEPVVDVYVGEDHQTGVAGVDLIGYRHENRDVGENRIRLSAEPDPRLNAGGLGLGIETDDVAGQCAMQCIENFMFQSLALFMGKGVIHHGFALHSESNIMKG